MELESQIQLILSIPILSPGICMALCLHILSIVHGYELSLLCVFVIPLCIDIRGTSLAGELPALYQQRLTPCSCF